MLVNRKLDIGHARKGYEGWETCDIRPGYADYDCDAIHVSSLGKFDHLYACMVLEHLKPWEISLALTDWYDALNPGGLLEIIVPDLEHIIRNLPNEEALHRLFGGDTVKGGPNDCPEQEHRWAFTKQSLEEAVTKVGFTLEFGPSVEGAIHIRAWKEKDVRS